MEQPLYEARRGLDQYEAILPHFQNKTLFQIIDAAIVEQGSVSVADLGAGEFIFAEACHTHPHWKNKVQVTGISLHKLITDERLEYLKSLGVSCQFIRTEQAQQAFSSQFDLVTSVFTDIYDPGTNYPYVAWEILHHGGIALLDNVHGRGQFSEWRLIEQQLHKQGYNLEFHNQKVTQATLGSNVYLKEYERLQKELPDYQPKPISLQYSAALSFKKDNQLPNIGIALNSFLPLENQ